MPDISLTNAEARLAINAVPALEQTQQYALSDKIVEAYKASFTAPNAPLAVTRRNFADVFLFIPANVVGDTAQQDANRTARNRIAQAIVDFEATQNM